MTKSERAALREHWRQIVTECENRDASISKRAWCEEHGIVLRLLYYWQRQFREGNDEPQSTPAFLDLPDVWEERHEKPCESSSMMPWSDAYRAYETEQKYEAIHNDFFDAEPPKPKAPPQHRRPLADVQNELCFG